jgi:hypothetical protein
MTRAPPRGKGVIIKGRHLAKEKREGEPITPKKPIHHPFKTSKMDIIHNLKPQNHLQACTLAWTNSPSNPSPAVLCNSYIKFVPVGLMYLPAELILILQTLLKEEL